MILFFGMQLIPIGYGVLYLMHSIRSRRRGQAAAATALLLMLLITLGVLLWEYLALP